MLTIEQRLQQLEDRDAIIARKNEYCRYADALEPDKMVSLFTEDIVASYQPGEPDLLGKQALHAYYSQALGVVVASSHHVSNFEIVFTDLDHAQLHCYLYSWQRLVTFPQQRDRHRWARYEDSWVRLAQGWFQSKLSYRIAGEVTSEGDPRIGEYLVH